MNSTNNIYLNQPKIFPRAKLKLGNENFAGSNIMNKEQNIDENPEDKLGYIFPGMTKESIKEIISRSGNNIGTAISLIEDMKKQELKLNKLDNPITKENIEKRKIKKGIRKRNYNESIRSIPSSFNQDEKNKKKIDTGRNIINISQQKINNNNPFTHNQTNGHHQTIIINRQNINNNPNQKEEININNQKNNENNQKNNNNISQQSINPLSNVQKKNSEKNSLDNERTTLINKQIDYLLHKFDLMKEKSELESLLKEIGFPTEKQDIKKDIELLQDKLEQQTKTNKLEIQNIVKKYEEIQKTGDSIEEKKIKLGEQSDTLGNLITVESDQKIREQKFKNLLTEALNKYKSNEEFIFGAREGY